MCNCTLECVQLLNSDFSSIKNGWLKCHYYCINTISLRKRHCCDREIFIAIAVIITWIRKYWEVLLPWHLSEKYKGASTMIRIIKKDTFGASTMSSRLKKELLYHKTFWCFYHEFRTQKRFSLIYIFGASTMSSRLKKDSFYDFLL